MNRTGVFAILLCACTKPTREGANPVQARAATPSHVAAPLGPRALDPGMPSVPASFDAGAPRADDAAASDDAHGHTSPRVRPVSWLCEGDLSCGGHPTYAYDFLPAVTEDGEHLAIDCEIQQLPAFQPPSIPSG